MHGLGQVVTGGNSLEGVHWTAGCWIWILSPETLWSGSSACENIHKDHLPKHEFSCLEIVRRVYLPSDKVKMASLVGISSWILFTNLLPHLSYHCNTLYPRTIYIDLMLVLPPISQSRDLFFNALCKKLCTISVISCKCKVETTFLHLSLSYKRHQTGRWS